VVLEFLKFVELCLRVGRKAGRREGELASPNTAPYIVILMQALDAFKLSIEQNGDQALSDQ
jgi:hypothetical protein